MWVDEVADIHLVGETCFLSCFESSGQPQSLPLALFLLILTFGVTSPPGLSVTALDQKNDGDTGRTGFLGYTIMPESADSYALMLVG